jgi:hypothetical protein
MLNLKELLFLVFLLSRLNAMLLNELAAKLKDLQIQNCDGERPFWQTA